MLSYGSGEDRWSINYAGGGVPSPHHWLGVQHNPSGPLGEYTPSFEGDTGTLTMAPGVAPELSITALADDDPPTVDITGQWYKAGSYDEQDYFMQWGHWNEPTGPRWYLWWDSTEPSAWRITNELGAGHGTSDAWWFHAANDPVGLTGDYGAGGDCQGWVRLMRL